MLLKHSWIRLFLLLILAGAGLTIGYVRWTYVILWDHGFTLINRDYILAAFAYPTDWQSLLTSLQKDPRWLSLIIYSLVPILISVSAVYLTFLRRIYVINTLVVYGFLWSIVIFLSILSLLFQSYSIGIGLAQNIKNLVQMPFVTLLLLAGFKVSEINSAISPKEGSSLSDKK